MKQIIHTLSDHNTEVVIHVLQQKADGMRRLAEGLTGDTAIENTNLVADALEELIWYTKREKKWLKEQQGPLGKET